MDTERLIERQQWFGGDSQPPVAWLFGLAIDISSGRTFLRFAAIVHATVIVSITDTQILSELQKRQKFNLHIAWIEHIYAAQIIFCVGYISQRIRCKPAQFTSFRLILLRIIRRGKHQCRTDNTTIRRVGLREIRISMCETGIHAHFQPFGYIPAYIGT